MSYIPKHAKPVASKEGKDGAYRTRGPIETPPGRHAAPGGRSRQAARAQARREKVAA